MTNIPVKKKHNSSIEAASVTLGIPASVIEMFMPAMLEAKQLYDEQNKIKTNRESIQDSQP